MQNGTVRRHDRTTVISHGILACTMLVLALTGLLINTTPPSWLTAAVGGHQGLVTVHLWVGATASAVLVILPMLAPKHTLRLIRNILHVRRSDLRWMRQAPGFLAHPRTAPPYHDGQFDPAQRALFLIIGVLLLVLSATGIIVALAPPDSQMMLAATVVVHNDSGYLMIAAMGTHIAAGSGLLPTHRGVVHAILNGAVPHATARRLWPGWARRRDTDASRPPKPGAEPSAEASSTIGPPG